MQALERISAYSHISTTSPSYIYELGVGLDLLVCELFGIIFGCEPAPWAIICLLLCPADTTFYEISTRGKTWRNIPRHERRTLLYSLRGGRVVF